MKKKLLILFTLMLCLVTILYLTNGQTHDDIKVEVEKVGFSRDGYFCELQYLVTLHGIKQTKLNDILPTMGGYEFGFIEFDPKVYTIQYQYNSDIVTLRKNQFLLTLRFTIEDNTITELPILFKDIGFWDENGKYISVCSYSFQDNINFESDYL